MSPTDHTRMAPNPDADAPIHIAVASCQDFMGRRHHTRRALLDEGNIHVVLLLVDDIYETMADPRHQGHPPRARSRSPTGSRSATTPTTPRR